MASSVSLDVSFTYNLGSIAISANGNVIGNISAGGTPTVVTIAPQG